MEEGFIPPGLGGGDIFWVEGPPEFGFLGKAKVGDRKKLALQAFRCPMCNQVLLFTGNRVY
jgi:hypothetical protein